MASLKLIEGPGGGGKSAIALDLVRSGQAHVLADLTLLWAALKAHERDAEGRFPIREDGDPGLDLAQYLKMVAIRQALREGLDVVTTSATPGKVTAFQAIAAELGASLSVRTEDLGQDTIRRRLAQFGGTPEALHPACESVVRRWYG